MGRIRGVSHKFYIVFFGDGHKLFIGQAQALPPAVQFFQRRWSGLIFGVGEILALHGIAASVEGVQVFAHPGERIVVKAEPDQGDAGFPIDLHGFAGCL